MTTESGTLNNLDFFTMSHKSYDFQANSEYKSSSILSLVVVIALHAGLMILVFGKAHSAPKPIETQLIQATIHTLIPQQNLSQEAKPLPAKAKARPQPKATMIAAPLAPAAESAPSDVIAPPPAATGSTSEDSAGEEAVTPPKGDANYLSNPAPEYPRLSIRAREEGKVLVRVYVEENGSASEVKLEQSSGFERLDRSALAAVAQWKFVPAKKGEKNVAAWVLVPIDFKLKG